MNDGVGVGERPAPAPEALGFLERRAPWVAASVALVAALLTMTADPIGGFNDDGIYLLVAKALAAGQGYVYPQLPGTPPAIHYPPVWPMLLALVWKVGPAFPANVGWLKLINPVVIAVAAALAVTLGRRLLGLPWWVALAGVVGATVSVPVLLLTNLLLSEPLFLLLLAPALFVTERLVRDGGWRRAAGAGALVALLVLVRTLGGVVLVAAVLLLARERRWRDLVVFLAVSTVLLLPWQIFVWRASAAFPDELRGSYGPYLEWMVDGYRAGGLPFFVAVVAKNLEATWEMIGVFTSPFSAGLFRDLTSAIAVVLFVSGLIASARRGQAPVMALALTGYLAIVIAWPFWVDRFYWVLWPLLVLVALAGAQALAVRLGAQGRRRAAATVVGVTVLLAAGHETYNVRGLARGWASSASRGVSGAGIRLIRQVNNTRAFDGRIVASELAPMLAIYTGLQVLPVEILTTREHVMEKTQADRTDELQRIDRRFRPEAYLVLDGGPFYPALMAAQFEAGRTLIDISPPGAPIRTLLVKPR